MDATTRSELNLRVQKKMQQHYTALYSIQVLAARPKLRLSSDKMISSTVVLA